MDGLILVHKPQKFTSHDIVVKIRDILSYKKIGHFGTLDPLATGLMVVALGKATRLFPFFSKLNKTYEGKIRLGISTDTYDSLGEPVSSEKKEFPDKDTLLEAMKKFEGEIDQIAPPFSAKKYKGKPLYVLAREKKDLKYKSSKVFIQYFLMKKYNPPSLDFGVKCSSGTYIRSLAHDLGQSLGCGAHLSALKRTEVGNFNIKESFSTQKIKKLTEEGKIESFLIPMELLLPEFPKVILDETGTVLARNGNMIFPDNVIKILEQEPLASDLFNEEEKIFRVFSLEGKLMALARKVPEKNGLHPFLVFNP
ncbi:MAG: tRNA pseudouridine(55) synthase TruB [Candidatus Aminicenantes bacterium]|nr:MAG: tRNA pseudouridine(55) synthase TruB [Candidatus Aminicenantes bacterium]